MAEKKIKTDFNFGSGNTLFINHINNWLYGTTDKPYLTLGSKYSWPNVTIRKVLSGYTAGPKVRLGVYPLFDWQYVPDRVRGKQLSYTLSSTRGNIVSKVPDLYFGIPNFEVVFEFDLMDLILNTYLNQKGDIERHPIDYHYDNHTFRYVFDHVNRHRIKLTGDNTHLFYSWPLYLKIFISDVKMAHIPLGKLAVKFPVVIRDNGAPYLEDANLMQVGYSRTGHFFGNSIK